MANEGQVHQSHAKPCNGLKSLHVDCINSDSIAKARSVAKCEDSGPGRNIPYAMGGERTSDVSNNAEACVVLGNVVRVRSPKGRNE